MVSSSPAHGANGDIGMLIYSLLSYGDVAKHGMLLKL
jgi:hypothetical protein